MLSLQHLYRAHFICGCLQICLTSNFVRPPECAVQSDQPFGRAIIPRVFTSACFLVLLAFGVRKTCLISHFLQAACALSAFVAYHAHLSSLVITSLWEKFRVSTMGAAEVDPRLVDPRLVTGSSGRNGLPGVQQWHACQSFVRYCT